VCRDFDEKWSCFNEEIPSRKEELAEIFDFYKSIGGKYDCLVPFSGGFDSTYTLYTCTRTYELKTLAYNFDNGFQSETARENIMNAVSKLDVDFIMNEPRWHIAKRLYALFFRKTGEFCTPCNIGIWSTSYKIAEDHDIPLIVSGSSDRMSERLPKGGRIYQWSPSYFKEVIRGEVPREDVADYLCLPKDFHSSLVRSISDLTLERNPQVLPLPDFIEWNTEQIMITLKTELNWRQKGDRFHHIDCTMEPVNDYFKQKKWGLSSSIWYSMLVRNGQIARDEALRLAALEEEKNSKEPPELDLWLEMLDLSRNDLEGFEKRSQLDYIPLEERK
jgi:hypothetical protein